MYSSNFWVGVIQQMVKKEPTAENASRGKCLGP